MTSPLHTENKSLMIKVNRKSNTMPRLLWRRLLRRKLLLVTTLLALTTTAVLFYDGLWTLFQSASARASNLSSPGTTQQPKVEKVLLVSESDCGARLVGDIIDLSPSIYYIFEPLNRLSSQAMKIYDWRFRGGNIGGFPDKLYSDSVALLDVLLTCGFSSMDLTNLDASALARHPKTATLARCVKAAAEAKRALNSGDGRVNEITSFAELSSCVKQAESECFNKTILLKVIGPRLVDLEPLLLRHRDLVVIYLVRDPRAMIWSRWNSSPKLNNISTLALSTCSILEDNLSSALELSQRHRGRVALLKYENMAEAPVETSKLLYSYLGLSWSDKTANLSQRAILQHSITKVSNPNIVLEAAAVTDLESPAPSSLDYDDVRENLFRSAHAWRRTIRWLHVKQIQSQCFSFMRQMGYELLRYQGDVKAELIELAAEQELMIDPRIMLDALVEPRA